MDDVEERNSRSAELKEGNLIHPKIPRLRFLSFSRDSRCPISTRSLLSLCPINPLIDLPFLSFFHFLTQTCSSRTRYRPRGLRRKWWPITSLNSKSPLLELSLAALSPLVSLRLSVVNFFLLQSQFNNFYMNLFLYNNFYIKLNTFVCVCVLALPWIVVLEIIKD